MNFTNRMKAMVDKETYLFILFGLPTWMLIDGTWAILSQLSDELPEQYKISSYLILSLTLGNLIPLVGYKLRECSPDQLVLLLKSILITGLVTGILMSIFWNYSVRLSSSSTPSSLPLYILFFVMGTCSSSSNITHYTYVSIYSPENTTHLSTGMGMGSSISGCLALLQGLVLSQVGFNVSLYYLVLSLLYVPAFLSLVSLERSKAATSSLDHKSFLDSSGYMKVPIDNADISNHRIDSKSEMDVSQQVLLVSPARQNWILVLQFLNASLGYGLIPAMVSFSCSKFSNQSINVLLLATSISAILDPLFKGLTNYVRIKSIEGFMYATVTLFSLGLSLLMCAILPADSSIYQSPSGGALPIILYISFCGLFGYSNTSIFRYFKDNCSPTVVQQAYRWCGISCQAGALVGSLTAFIVVITDALS